MILRIKPQTKERHRHKGNISYTPAKTRKYQEDLGKLYKAAGGELHTGALKITVGFWYKTKDKKKWLKPKTSRPDLDNLVKALDGLNGIAWEDDASIVEISAYKGWAEDDYIYLEIDNYIDLETDDNYIYLEIMEV